jgi:hypothetical protein
MKRLIAVMILMLGLLALVACEDNSDGCVRSSGGGCIPSDVVNL